MGRRNALFGAPKRALLLPSHLILPVDILDWLEIRAIALVELANKTDSTHLLLH